MYFCLQSCYESDVVTAVAGADSEFSNRFSIPGVLFKHNYVTHHYALYLPIICDTG